MYFAPPKKNLKPGYWPACKHSDGEWSSE